MQLIIVKPFGAYVPGFKHPGSMAEDTPQPLWDISRAYATHWRNAYNPTDLARRLKISRITLMKYLAEDAANHKKMESK